MNKIHTIESFEPVINEKCIHMLEITKLQLWICSFIITLIQHEVKVMMIKNYLNWNIKLFK